jgi:Flp pilus assembly protein TadD
MVAALWPLGDRPSRASQHLDFARALLHQGEPSQAAHFAARATEVQPRHGEAWALRGRALRLSGRAAAAVEILQPQVMIHRESAALRRELGAALLALDRPVEAARELEAAINLRPGDIDAWLALGDAMERLGCWPRAREAYRAAIRLAPTTAKAQRAQMRLHELRATDTGGAGDSSGCPE